MRQHYRQRDEEKKDHGKQLRRHEDWYTVLLKELIKAVRTVV
jgi:hypothetical protein